MENKKESNPEPQELPNIRKYIALVTKKQEEYRKKSLQLMLKNEEKIVPRI